MANEAEAIRVERRGDGAVFAITMCRPPLNILDIPALSALGDALEAAWDDPAARLVVLDAAADARAFSAGVDVADHTADRVADMIGSFHRVFRILDRVAVPTLAVVDGAALGGGCELAAAFDIVLASDRAKFGQPEIRLGAFAPVASILLPAAIGPKRAADWLFTGRTVTAAEAHGAGLVSRVVAAADLAATASALEEEIIASSGAALRLAKRALKAGCEAWCLQDRLAPIESLYLDDLMATHDIHEGLAAFADRRAPQWEHR